MEWTMRKEAVNPKALVAMEENPESKGNMERLVKEIKSKGK